MAIHGVAARSARTSYRVLETFPGFAVVEAKLHTGRTHQIRVHMAAIGHPVAGDTTYHGASVAGLDRQFLHAHRLDVRSPATGEHLSFTAELPPDLADVLERLRKLGRN
jgi:23S rRNA pseudouridine1911/1915/1917 synthase